MRILATAAAKLTLSLRVLGRRPDGFHELEALVVSVGSPSDELEIWDRAAPGVGFEVDSEGEAHSAVSRQVQPAEMDLWPGGPSQSAEPLGAGEDNLVVRAVARLLEVAGGVGVAGATGPGSWGIEARLRKRIPVAAGLGGGSADAAAALLGVRELLSGRDEAVDARLSDAALREIAASIGSDVVFCLVGGPAWMRGRGERIEPAGVVSPDVGPVLVATPAFGLSTASVYRAWDELGGPTSARKVSPPPWAETLVDALENDLEPAAEHLAPGLRAFREALQERAGAPAILAGSGPSCAVLLGPERAAGAAELADEVRSRLGARVFVGGVETEGVRVERRAGRSPRAAIDEGPIGRGVTPGRSRV